MIFDFEKLRRNSSKVRVGIVGDIILDKYLFGRAEKLSPEAPVPILIVEREEYRLGGSANVAANLSKAGARVYLWGDVGDTPQDDSQVLRGLLREANISGEYNLPCPHRRVTTKTRLVAANQQLLRVDYEDTSPIGEAEQKIISESISSTALSALVIMDYNKGLVPHKDFVETLCHICEAKKILLGVDPRRNFEAYSGVGLHFLKCNLSEFLFYIGYQAGYSTLTDWELAGYMSQVGERMGIPRIMVTLGSRGAVIWETDIGAYKVVVPQIEVFDVTGAGDSTLAYLSLGLSLDLPFPEAALLACLAGREAVSRLGTVAVSWDDLSSVDLHEYSPETLIQPLENTWHGN